MNANDATAIESALRRRALISAFLGNSFEWFDFVAFTLLSGVFAKLFFPAADQASSLLLTFGTLGVTFIVRPIGGIVLGIFADRFGRKRALSLVFVLMSVGTITVAVLPTYATIGIAAPILLVLARVVQGFSVGGEFAISTVTLVEIAPRGRKAFYGSIQIFSQVLANFLAAVVVTSLIKALPQSALYSWGWRVPFLIGSIIGPVGLYIRLRNVETPAFVAEGNRATRQTAGGILEAVAKRGAAMFAVFCIVAAMTGPVYVSNVYIPAFVNMKFGLSQVECGTALAIATFFMLFAVMIFGRLADRYSIFSMIGAGLVLMIVTYPICFYHLMASPNFKSLLQLQIVTTMALALIAAPAATIIAVVFPTALRSTSVSAAYNLSVMLFGGLAPFTLSWLLSRTSNIYSPAIYIVSVEALGLVGLAYMRGLRPSEAENPS
jgi:MFS family permease